MKTYGYIYKIVCKNNGKLYIGQTTRDLEDRLKSHFYESVNEHRSITKLGSAILKYGRENFKIYPLCKAFSKKELDHREILCINLFNSIEKGYNIKKGGQSTGLWNEEQKRKMSLFRKGKPKPEGFGEKIRKALKGKKKSESHIRNNRQAQIKCQAHREYRHSDESRKKISLGNKNKKMPPGFGEGVAKRNRERGPASEETKKKMSEKRLGRKPNQKPIYCITNSTTYPSIKIAAESLLIGTDCIQKHLKGIRKSVKGFTFKYV